jgi:UMF1 family MFS transporter
MPSRRQAAWVLYDWGYGAFTTVVSTFVIATYVTRAVAPSPALGASAWGAMQAVSGVAIALLSVPLGALADHGGRSRLLLALSTAIMAAATLALYAIRPRPGDLLPALLLVGLATVAFEVATVFYNAMLPVLASPGRLGRLSMVGWAAGYFGGLCSLALCLALIGLGGGGSLPVRRCALLAGGWIALFGCPVLLTMRDRPRPWRAALREGWATLRATWRDAVALPRLRRFLLARALYTDGLVTLFAFGGIYAAQRFGLSPRGVLWFGIRLTVAAGIGTLAGAALEDRLGSRATALGSVLAVAALGAAVLLVGDRAVFMALAAALGLFVGPAQAATRSMMARLAPAEAPAAYFGLFALSGRVTAFAGPAVLSALTWATGSLRCGMASIVVFLLAGAALLAGVRSTR